MKSIYEASVAYGEEHQGTVNIEAYESGANYVLDEIENVINADRILGNPFPTIIERLYTIMDTIKRLKEE